MIVIDRIMSRELVGNALSNEPQRDVVVYLPDGYESTPERFYSTIYLLHGFSNRARYWPYGPALAFGALHPPIDHLIRQVTSDFHLPEMIVVMPDGWGNLGCSQWVDSPASGRFESHVVREVVAHVDANYRTIASSDSRGIMGISSGGFGAWHIGTRHPQVFGAVGLLSAGSYFELTYKHFFYRFYNSIYPNPPRGPVDGDIFSWMCFGMAAAYSPNLSNPPTYSDLPIDFPSGQVIPEVWARWLHFDPVLCCQEREESLRLLRGLLLDVGCHDEFGLHYGHRLLSNELNRLGIKHTVREHRGNHTSHLFDQIRNALHWFAHTLQTDTARA